MSSSSITKFCIMAILPAIGIFSGVWIVGTIFSHKFDHFINAESPLHERVSSIISYP